MREATLQFLKASLVEDEAELRAIKQSLTAIKDAVASGGNPVVTWGQRTGAGDDAEGEKEAETEGTWTGQRLLTIGLAVLGISLLGFGAYSYLSKKK